MRLAVRTGAVEKVARHEDDVDAFLVDDGSEPVEQGALLGTPRCRLLRGQRFERGVQVQVRRMEYLECHSLSHLFSNNLLQMPQILHAIID